MERAAICGEIQTCASSNYLFSTSSLFTRWQNEEVNKESVLSVWCEERERKRDRSLRLAVIIGLHCDKNRADKGVSCLQQTGPQTRASPRKDKAGQLVQIENFHVSK